MDWSAHLSRTISKRRLSSYVAKAWRCVDRLAENSQPGNGVEMCNRVETCNSVEPKKREMLSMPLAVLRLNRIAGHQIASVASMKLWLVSFLWFVSCTCIHPELHGDEVVIQQGSKSVPLVGNILVEAQDGGLLFETRDSRLWIIQPEQIVKRTDNDTEVEPFTLKELKAQLQEELPESFRFHDTDHFLICHNTEISYAKWVGDIYERLYRGFKEYWTHAKRKYPVVDADQPLVIVIYRNREEYVQQVRRELGQDPGTMVAYFNIDTNRVTMYDLTAELGGMNSGNRNINAILTNPNAIPMVTTVVHEGTHQLMFNCGMQTRRADTPLWLNEGLAMFFETPDLNNRKGWGKIGQVNVNRLLRFRQYLASRNLSSLRELIQDDQMLRPDHPQVLDRYAEAWAFNYFLLERHASAYVAYLKHMSTKKPCVFDTPEQRLSEFEMFFKKDLASLDQEFVSYMQGLIAKMQ